MKKKPNPHGEGKKLISTTLPLHLFDQLSDLAKACGKTRSDYARSAIIRTVQAKIQFTETEIGIDGFPKIENLARAAEEPPKYGSTDQKP